MKTAKVTFHKIIVEKQVLGGDEECILSKVVFSLEIEGQRYENLSVPLKQVVGTTYEEKAFEVGIPKGYGGPFNYEHFRKVATDYYVVDTGAFAKLLKVHKNSKVILESMTFEQEITFEMTVENI